MIFLLLSIFVALLALAYRARARQATRAANRNAGLWAEAEERADMAEAELSALQAAHAMLQKCYEDMKRIASQALGTAKEKHFPQAKIDAYLNDDTVIGSTNAEVHFARTPNFIAVDCRNCSAPIQRVASEFPLNCPICGQVVDPVLDSDTVL